MRLLGRRDKPEHPDVLRARAETLSECVALAQTYERKGANAGVVRHILAGRSVEAWGAYYLRTHPTLDEEPGRDGSGPSPSQTRKKAGEIGRPGSGFSSSGRRLDPSPQRGSPPSAAHIIQLDDRRVGYSVKVPPA